MNTHRLISESEEETFRLGYSMAGQLGSQALVCLSGELGSGKTVLIRGACAALGVPPGVVRSPSFTLINEYQGRLTVCHADLYRLDNSSAVPGTGLYDYLDEPGIVFIEWAEKMGELPAGAIRIECRHAGGNRREISVTWGPPFQLQF